MVENKYFISKLLIGYVFLMGGFFGLFFPESLFKICLLGFSLIGFFLFIIGWNEMAESEFLGKPISFHRLKRGLVYEVVAKTSAPDLIIIMGPEKQSTIIVIPPFLEKDLKEGEKFIRVDMLTITKVP